MASGQEEGNRPAKFIGQGMDLGGAAAARSADRLVEFPFFPPAALRWARTGTATAVQSATWPPVRRKATGLQRSSVRAWILAVRPPRDRPIAWLGSPFFLPPRCGGLGRQSNR